MNLRVDLILDAERRSASVVSLKSLLRILCFVGPALVVLLVGWFVWNLYDQKNALRRMQDELDSKKPRQEYAAALRGQVNTALDVANEVAGWKQARAQWHENLAALRKTVPPEVQLMSLTVNHEVQPTEQTRVPARNYTLVLGGQAFGNAADAALDSFDRNLKGLGVGPTNAPMFTKVDLRGQPVKGSRCDRKFEVNCAFPPLEFK
jgi:Tfp pilus assembly protein PilN